MSSRSEPSWTRTLTELSDFARTVGLPMATWIARIGEWSGVGLTCSKPNQHGQVKVAMRKADGSEWPLSSLTQPVRLEALLLIADMIVQTIAWKEELANTPPLIVEPAIAHAEAFIRRQTATRGGVCPRCHRKINGEFLSCVCPPEQHSDAGPVALLARAVTTLRSAEARIATAVGTARLESYERNDIKAARGDIGQAKSLIESAAVAIADPIAA